MQQMYAAAGAVMNTGDETIAGAKTFSSTIVGSVTGNAGTVTNGIYTTSSVTDLADVTSVGSGAIITAAERTKLASNRSKCRCNRCNKCSCSRCSYEYR
jgi:hypothetical protein